METIGDKIMRLRTNRGIGREKFCELNPNVKYPTLRSYEEGLRDNHSIETLQEIAKGLDVPVETLYQTDEEAYNFNQDGYEDDLDDCKMLPLNEKILLQEHILRILDLDEIDKMSNKRKKRTDLRAHSFQS